MKVQEIAKTLDLGEEEALMLVKLFLETSAADLNKLQSAIASGDAEQAFCAAHSIKGAAGNLSFQDVYDLAEMIEMKGRQNILEGSMEAANYLKEKLRDIENDVC